MSWTDAGALRQHVEKLWQRGDLLAALVTGDAMFPRRLPFKGPSSSELAERFDEVRRWIAALCNVPHCRVTLRTVNHRQLGSNAVPDAVWIDSMDDAAALIGTRRELARFINLLDATRASQPALLTWLAKRPLRALELGEAWPRLLAIVTWLQHHPRPGIYLRQVDIPGVHSKFIESHRGVLSELLDAALPPEAIDASATGAAQFAQRYGFLDKPLRVRVRLLDPALAPDWVPLGPDLTLDAFHFAQLALPVRRVFMTENEINFLAFPPMPGSILIFGGGYGFDMLREARWLNRCQIYYWGDIDTHGFAILDQLRGQFAQVASFLMDRDTLLACAGLWGEEEKPARRDLARLTAAEAALYDDLRDNRLGRQVRLEQERIAFGRVAAALAGMREDE
jgi:hypothetical protein